jgi:hypothetical protein
MAGVIRWMLPPLGQKFYPKNHLKISVPAL